MTQDQPMLVPTEADVVIANVLPSGAAFGVRADTGDNCYVPANVSRAVGLAVGSDFSARLVPNRFPDKAERTPWMVVHLSPVGRRPDARPVQYSMPFEQFDMQEAEPAPLTTADRVRRLMKAGGVWTMASLFDELFPGAIRGGAIQDYNAISAAVRGMYAKGECAKFQLWRTSDQSKPSREWFTCFPERADVDEWED